MAPLPFNLAEFPMLNTCTQPGCSTILLGTGRCLAHERAAAVQEQPVQRASLPALVPGRSSRPLLRVAGRG